MVKPELCAPGGSFALDEARNIVIENDLSLQVLGAGGRDPARLLALGVGTSFAAPLVTNAALRVWQAYPNLTANGVRALLLVSCLPPEAIVTGFGAAENANQQRKLTGYGRVSADNAESSSDHRAVLLAENQLIVDDVHLYTVTIPTTFFDSGGTRTLSFSLAFDPTTRPTRLDYLSSRMMVRIFRGVTLDDVRLAYVEQIEAELAADEQSQEDLVEAPPSLRSAEVKLQPADSRRGRGAHQYGSKTFHQRLERTAGEEFIVAVRNTNRWAPAGDQQTYALAVSLERDLSHPELYSELSAELQALTEVEVELDLG